MPRVRMWWLASGTPKPIDKLADEMPEMARQLG